MKMLINRKLSGSVFALFLATLIVGCGGGGAGGDGGGDGGGGGGGGGTGAASLSLSLIDPNTGNTSNTLTSGSPLTLTALAKDATGAVAPNIVVTFTTNASYGVMSPASGTALTNSSGIASINLNAGATTGATTVTATAHIGTTDVTANYSYSVNVAQLGLSAISFGVNPLSAYGTTSITLTVTSGGSTYTTPVDVSFSSNCASAGKAILPATVHTINGVATASYQDNGCGATDTITATLANGASRAGTLTVNLPSISSLQFVSANPTNISVKGMGGNEVSTVTFRVLDSGGNPIGGTNVNFSLNTSVGGLNLSSSTAVSNVAGNVVTQVNAGTILTPVRVTATTPSTTPVLSTQSSQLYVSTMIPDQAHFSLSVTNFNTESWDYDGVLTDVTARLADRFGNPVPDGTAVVFTAEGGAIQPGCSTSGGACTVTWTSQNPRPADGRLTILAYAVGEESFIDANGNGRFDSGESFTDLAEAYRDDNESGTYALGELFVDFNSNSSRNTGDGAFTGVLCNSGCAASNTLNVRGSAILTFSRSTAVQPIIAPNPIDLGGCGVGAPGSIIPVTLTIKDANNNPLPFGTTVTAALTGNGKLIGTSSFTVESHNQVGGNIFTVRIQNDASGTPCTDENTSGALSVTVTSPKNIITEDSAAVMH
jgi:hypothetical protein